MSPFSYLLNRQQQAALPLPPPDITTVPESSTNRMPPETVVPDAIQPAQEETVLNSGPEEQPSRPDD